MVTKRCCLCTQTLSIKEFYKDRSRKDGRKNQCKSCCAGYMRTPGYLKCKSNYNMSLGIGVYKVLFSNDRVYIGSGVFRTRKQQHLGGFSKIARTLGEKALSFEMLISCKESSDALYLEKELIKDLGLENLVNTKA